MKRILNRLIEARQEIALNLLFPLMFFAGGLRLGADNPETAWNATVAVWIAVLGMVAWMALDLIIDWRERRSRDVELD